MPTLADLTDADLAAQMRAKVMHWYLSGACPRTRSRSLRDYIDRDLWGEMHRRTDYGQDRAKLEAAQQAYALAWLLGRDDAAAERRRIAAQGGSIAEALTQPNDKE